MTRFTAVPVAVQSQHGATTHQKQTIPPLSQTDTDAEAWHANRLIMLPSLLNENANLLQ